LCAAVHLPALGLAIGIGFRITGLICLERPADRTQDVNVDFRITNLTNADGAYVVNAHLTIQRKNIRSVVNSA
jgi:hypothetical protein